MREKKLHMDSTVRYLLSKNKDAAHSINRCMACDSSDLFFLGAFMPNAEFIARTEMNVPDGKMRVVFYGLCKRCSKPKRRHKTTAAIEARIEGDLAAAGPAAADEQARVFRLDMITKVGE